MQCPNLEHLAWTPIHSMPFTSLVFHLTTLPRGEPCRIASLDFTNTDLADKDFALVLSCIPTLRRLIAIESPFAEMCCLQVVYFMSETLEELDLRNCVSVTSAFIQLILLTCKRMKRFRADQLDAGIMVARPADYKTTSSSQLQTSEEARSWISSIRNASAAISSPPSSSSHQISEMTSLHMDWTWACTGLEELELTFRELGNYGDSVTDVLFDQLAALTQLQKLVLGWHHDSSKKKGLLPEPLLDTQLATLDLSLRCGGLSKLRTLTNLRDFDVQHVDLMAMTIEDVLWMGEHWKSLRRLRGALTADKTEEDRIRAALAKDYLHITLL
ncbi:hypothetical protein BGZ58_008921 [Dissophora ornata]|nr:hypothetical protein BGZ58_008921 [Dissophora ornata]